MKEILQLASDAIQLLVRINYTHITVWLMRLIFVNFWQNGEYKLQLDAFYHAAGQQQYIASALSDLNSGNGSICCTNALYFAIYYNMTHVQKVDKNRMDSVDTNHLKQNPNHLLRFAVVL